jgi:hypothetical protein
MKMRSTTTYAWIVAALALCAAALWPAFVKQREDAARAASLPTAAPITADYLDRDRTIASAWRTTC